MTMRAPFNPKQGANQVLVSGSSSSSVAIDAVSKSVRILNSGMSVAHFRIGSGTQTATTADTPIYGGADIIVSKADGQGTFAHISPVGTTLHVQPGEGGV